MHWLLRDDGHALADDWVQPRGFVGGHAAWVYDKFADWVFTRGEPEWSLTPR